MSKERIIQLRARHQRAGVPARAARQVHPAAGGGDAAVQPRHRLARRTRRPSWSSAASISARRRARSSAGAGWPRSGRCSCDERDRGLPRRHPGSGAVHPRPPHLARAARRQPRPDHRGGHPGHRRAGADSMRTQRREDVEPLVNLADITEIELVILKRMREVTHRRSPQPLARLGLRLRRPARLAGRRPVLVDRLGAVDAHQLQPARRPRVRAAEHGDGRRVADVSLSTRCGVDGVPIAAAIARAIATIGLSAVFFQDPFGLITFDARLPAPGGIRPRTGKSHVVHCLDAYQHQRGLQDVKRDRRAQHDARRLPAQARRWCR